MEYEPFAIALGNHEVKRDGTRVDITQKEYELIVFPFRNISRILSRAHILESVWGRNPDINTRTFDTHVSRIRTKLSLAPEMGLEIVVHLPTRISPRTNYFLGTLNLSGKRIKNAPGGASAEEEGLSSHRARQAKPLWYSPIMASARE